MFPISSIRRIVTMLMMVGPVSFMTADYNAFGGSCVCAKLADWRNESYGHESGNWRGGFANAECNERFV